MQTLIVILVIILSIAYAVIRFVRLTRAKNSPCCDCPGCALKDQMHQKRGNTCCECKKSHKNFAG